MRLLAWCCMPNHFHFVLWPRNDGDLSAWMQWLLTSHVRRYHLRYGTSGRVWQGRFKAFPIEDDAHLLVVQRYVERNPLRAGLVERAEDWRWSSLRAGTRGDPSPFRHPGPVPRPENWEAWVNEPLTGAELERVRQSVNRQTPYGSESWTLQTAKRLDLLWTLRRPGRPRDLES